jgi:hypothetical protein
MSAGPKISMVMYEFIVEYKHSHDGNSPTYQEIADGLGVKSLNTIFAYIHGMVDAGILIIKDRKLCTTDGWWNHLSIPKE